MDSFRRLLEFIDGLALEKTSELMASVIPGSDGELFMNVEGPASLIKIVLDCWCEEFIKADGKNVVGFSGDHPLLGPVNITIQKRDGDSLAQVATNLSKGLIGIYELIQLDIKGQCGEGRGLQMKEIIEDLFEKYPTLRPKEMS